MLPSIQFFVHYGLHFLFPGLIARVYYQSQFKNAWIIMASMIIIDLDHLLADPIYDPGRCSVGPHILHSEYAVLIYIILFCIPKTRLIGTGLLIHILADLADCLFM